jgi:hypothetical protein
MTFISACYALWIKNNQFDSVLRIQPFFADPDPTFPSFILILKVKSSFICKYCRSATGYCIVILQSLRPNLWEVSRSIKVNTNWPKYV